MTRPACEDFRLSFRPGLRGPHFDACAACRSWAQDVESWRSLGARAALPQTLRARLVAIPAQVAHTAPSQVAPPPPATLPEGLRRKLLKIPAAERARGRVLKARYAVAASYLLAGLLTLAASGASTRPPTYGLAQASARGTAALRDVNDWILAGCGRATETLERLFGHLGAGPVPARPPAAPKTEQEDTDGTRTAP